MHRLFFAIFLDAAAGAAAIEVGRRLRLQHGLRGKVQPAHRLHVTLQWLRDHETLPAELVRAARRAGARTADSAAPFDVAFDRAESLGDAGLRRKLPLVLGGSDGLAALRAFQRMLGGAMSDEGIGRYARSAFRPHVTLLRDEVLVTPQPVGTVHWKVRELALVDSGPGLARYDLLGQWPLTSHQRATADG